MTKPDNQKLIQLIHDTPLHSYQYDLVKLHDQKFNMPMHGRFENWLELVNSLPDIFPSCVDFNLDTPLIGYDYDCSKDQINHIKKVLLSLSPWRKGPFEIFGIHIDSEWISYMKWNRIKSFITDLNDKIILDIGCGNGYYALRMQGMGAKAVIGIDPSWLFVFQNIALQKYTRNIQRTIVLPFSLEELPDLNGFDVIFSMGVLYHRREPIIHLNRIYHMLAESGQFILETLVIRENSVDKLVPRKRYANMRNVWEIPSCSTLKYWLENIGFKDIKIVDVTLTTIEEQRKTPWISGYSLSEALDPCDKNLTIEGYPAPTRACLVCTK